MAQTATRIRRTGAGAGIGALVASALMFAPSAQAATEVNVTNKDVLPTANVYTSWHQGYANNPTGAKVTAKGLELTGGKSQVIKGYADNNETIVPANPNFNIEQKITGSRFTASEGVATLQIPLRSSNVTATGKFTTLYSMPDDGSRVKTSDLWVSTANIGTDIVAGTKYPLTTILGALGDYKVIGFGVQAESNAVVTDITWDGVTYKFKDPVDKLTSDVDIYRVNPTSGKITTRSTVSFYATVKVDGKSVPAGTIVHGFAKSKKVTTGKVNKSGKVKLTLPNKLPKGKSTLKVALYSSGTFKGSTDSIKVTVK